MFDPTGMRVWVAGHRGLVGSALVRRLEREPVGEIVTATSAEVDLRRQGEAERFVSDARPDVIFLAAGRVGGKDAESTKGHQWQALAGGGSPRPLPRW